MSSFKDNLLVGPDLQKPIPPVSFGRRLYECMFSASPKDVLYIDAISEKQTTYTEFLNLCCRLAKSLQNCGYQENDVIAVFSENSEFYFAPIVAALFLGIISAPINHTYKKRELSHSLCISQPKIIFCSKNVLASILEQEQVTFAERVIILDSEVNIDGFDTMMEFINKHCENNFCAERFDPVDVDPFNHVAAIMCSSGTTGLSKGVMVTHDNIAMRSNQLTDTCLNGLKHEIICACLPFFHAFGFMMVITGMPKKNTYVMLERFAEEPFLRAIDKYKVNAIHIVPPIAYILAKSPMPLKYDLSSIQEVLVGAAPLSQDIEASINQRFPTIKEIRQGYGLTEATMSVALMPNGEKRLGSVGKMVPGISAYVKDLETGKTLGPNKKGELCFKGRMITKGYYRNPEATKHAYVNGWLHTGDVGYYDQEGYIFVVDRLKELIKYKGFLVPPAELEGILLTHPDIRDVGVVGKPDNVAGELPTAFVVKNPLSDLTETEIIEFIAGQVSKPKHLHGGVYFVDSIPKTVSGKIERKKIYFLSMLGFDKLDANKRLSGKKILFVRSIENIGDIMQRRVLMPLNSFST